MSFFNHEFSLPIAGDTYPHQENTLMTPFLFDWNEDGYLDIWFGNGSMPGTPLVEEEPWLILSDGAGGFKTGNSEVFSGPLATNVHPRYFAFEDFNGDGVKDIFISDNGQEQEPFSGHPNVLYLSNEDGKLEDASDRLPGFDHFSHNMAAGDIDNDGDKDIFIANNADNTPVSYLLINDGVGNFTVNTSRLPDHLTTLETHGRYTRASFFDVDGDGYNDLILGSERNDPGWNELNPFSGSSLIIYNDGTGNFTEQNTYIIPAPVFPGNLSLISVQYLDFQNDGHVDLIFGYEGDATNATQVYLNNGDGTFSNETASRLDGPVFGDDVLSDLYVVDVNGDGYTDIVPDSRTPFFWINDGEGYFTAADESVLLPPEFAGYVYVGPLPGSAGPLNYFQGPFDGDSYVYNFVRQTTPISTGPNYTDPASSGVPYFNEQYYLRVNPDANAAVEAETYATGFAHYLAVGQAQNLRIAANIGNNQNDLLFAGQFGSNVVGNAGADTLFGGAADDTLLGGSGVDWLNGHAGDDGLSGGAGQDTLRGGEGADTLDGGVDADNLFGESGNDIVNGDAGNDSLLGGFGNDTMDGGDDNDTLNGERGFDSLLGGDGDDLLIGGGGNDRLNGEGGNDTLQGGFGFDRLEGSTGNDLLQGEGGNDTLRGAGGEDTLEGGAGVDVIFGGSTADIIDGGAGNDRIRSEAGNDTVNGGADNDRIFGSFGFDSIMGDDGNDFLDGNGGNDTLEGGGGADELIGNFGFDSLDGGAGNDTLEGAGGNDTLTGGAGDDTFLFAVGDDSDTIADFVAGAGADDVIELSGFGAAFDTFAEVQSAASQSGADVVIDFGGGDTIRIINANLGDLHQDDFVFV